MMDVLYVFVVSRTPGCVHGYVVLFFRPLFLFHVF